MTDRELMEMALEALASYEQYIHPLTDYFGGPEVPREGSTSAKVEDAIIALRERLASWDALERMANNARELGLDYDETVKEKNT